MPHVDGGTLHAYLDGELPGPGGARLTAPLAECAVCRARLEEERALAHRARDLLALAAPPVPRARRRVRPWRTLRLPLAWAATVAAALGRRRFHARRLSAPRPIRSVDQHPGR